MAEIIDFKKLSMSHSHSDDNIVLTENRGLTKKEAPLKLINLQTNI